MKLDAVINEAKRTRINSEELGFAAKQPVYVNEHLCLQLKKLLAMAIARKRELDWRFAWSTDDKVYIPEQTLLVPNNQRNRFGQDARS